MVLGLTPWGQVLYMAIGAGVIVITLIVVTCFLGPGCWGYEWIHREEERRRRRQGNYIAEDALKLSDYGYRLARDPVHSYSSYDTVSSTGSLIGRMPHHRDSALSSTSGRMPQHRDSALSSTSGRMPQHRDSALSSTSGCMPQHRDSAYSSMSEATDNRSVISMKSVTTEGSCGTDCSANDGPSVLNMSLQYVANDENGTGRLVIHIKDVKSLPPREYSGGLEPYLVLQVVRTTWPLHRRAGPPLHQLRTRTLRHSYNPFFDQTFVLDVRRSELKEWCLKVTAYDQDKFSSATQLCEANLALRDVKNLTTAQEALTISCNLARSNKETGELLFGMSYLPTAQRLSVSVVRGRNLKYFEIVDSVSDFHPYVRVIQLHGSTGRAIKRKKTTPKQGTECPEFNETLTFDLYPNQLDTTTFLLLLCSRTLGEESVGQTGRKIKDRCLGKVALGSHVAGKEERGHWLTVIQNPRRIISAWHTVK